jgi:hypothetical protein
MLPQPKAGLFCSGRSISKKLGLPDHNSYVAPHFRTFQESGHRWLAQSPGGLFSLSSHDGNARQRNWDFGGRTSTSVQLYPHPSLAWYGKVQSREQDQFGADHVAGRARLFVSNYRRNGNGTKGFCSLGTVEPSSSKVAVSALAVPALNIPAAGFMRSSRRWLHRRRRIRAGSAQHQLRHSNARTTLGYVHLRGGITEPERRTFQFFGWTQLDAAKVRETVSS